MNKLFLSMMTVAAACIVPAYAADAWILDDMEQAKKVAAETNRSLLIEFAGSDWCPPCMAFEKNVLKHNDFIEKAQQNFVLLVLDWPKKRQQVAAVKKRNQELFTAYGIDNVPTIVFADASGVPFGVFSGSRNKEAVYEEMEKALANKELMNKAREKAAHATGKEKIMALLEMKKLAPPRYVDSDLYCDLNDELVAIDTTDLSGLRAKERAELQSKALDEKFDSLKDSLNNKQAIRDLLDKFEQEYQNLEPEVKQRIVSCRAQILLSEGQIDEGLKMLEDGVQLAPESLIGRQMERLASFVKANKSQILDAKKGKSLATQPTQP